MADTSNRQPHNRYKPRNINSEHRANLGLQDRIALAITTAVGTMYAVYIFVALLAGWMLWQGMASSQPFDPYPFALHSVKPRAVARGGKPFHWPLGAQAPKIDA